MSYSGEEIVYNDFNITMSFLELESVDNMPMDIQEMEEEIVVKVNKVKEVSGSIAEESNWPFAA